MSASASARVRVTTASDIYVGKQGFSYRAGVSAETMGTERVCMNVLPMPPEARAKAHYHRGIETIAYLLEGRCAVYFGDQLEQRADMKSGEMIFIPADVPHVPCNNSGAHCTWIVVHSSGSDQDGIVLLPGLDTVLAAKLAKSHTIA